MGLESVKVGDVIFAGVHGCLAPVIVDKKTRFRIGANGLEYGISDGCRVGGDKWARSRAYVETPELRAEWDLKNLDREFARTLAKFRSVPQTKERLLEVLKVLDPEAWKTHGP